VLVLLLNFLISQLQVVRVNASFLGAAWPKLQAVVFAIRDEEVASGAPAPDTSDTKPAKRLKQIAEWKNVYKASRKGRARVNS